MISGPVSRTLRGNTGPVQEGQKPENEERLVSVGRDVPDRLEFERLFIPTGQE